MANTTSSVVGVFQSRTEAERALEDLASSGFDRSQIQIASGDNYSSLAAFGNTGLTGSVPASQSTGGGISGFFRNLFGTDEDESNRYDRALRSGNYAVIVNATSDLADRASDILDRHDPIDIDQFDASDRSSARETEGGRSIPVVEESLQVGKRSVSSGGVRVYSRVIEEPVQENIELREERVHVERRPVNRAATEADFRQSDEVIEVTGMSEEAVIGKQARVTEEVVIGKEQTKRTETVRDTLRRTDINVEEINSGSTEDYESGFRTDFKTRYASAKGARYEDYAPAYQYGHRMAGDSRYSGKSWNDVESQFRTDYARDYPESNWEKTKDAVRHGWEKMTGKR